MPSSFGWLSGLPLGAWRIEVFDCCEPRFVPIGSRAGLDDPVRLVYVDRCARQLVLAIERACREGGHGRLQRFAGDDTSLMASLAGRRDRTKRTLRSLEPAAAVAAAVAPRPEEEEPILRARREANLGPARLAGWCRRARLTV